MTSLVETLQTQQKNRRFPNWQPESTTAKCAIAEPNLGVLRRFCALRDLEIQVGDWIGTNAAEDEAIEAVIDRNVRDEQRHAKTIDYLREYVGACSEEEQADAEAIINMWQSLPETFISAYSLEMGVFFTLLPWMVKNGDVYTARVSQWISDDEAVHVRNHLTLAMHFRQKLTNRHKACIVATLEWLFKDYPADVAALCVRALKRVKTGKDYEMYNESMPVTPAFFEQRDKRKIVY